MKRTPLNITARQLLDLLATRHNQDIFVPECKNGPTQGVSGMQRIDAWAMKKSWAHPLAVAYEIKVSRSDFLSDDKWRGYLPYCNQFVFVAPAGVIKASEVPEEAGLQTCSPNATRLYTKKKAPYREVDIPDSIYRYVLFSRVRVMQGWEGPDEDNASFWRRWLREKRELEGLGSRVSRTLQRRIKAEITKRDTKQRQLAAEVENLTDARKMLTSLGFAPDYVPDEWDLKQRLKTLKEIVPSEIFTDIREAEGALRRLSETLKQAAAGTMEVVSDV